MQSSILDGCILFCIYTTCSVLSKKKKKKVITGMAYLVNESGMKVSSRFVFFFFVKKNKTKENYQVETSTGGITMVIIGIVALF